MRLLPENCKGAYESFKAAYDEMNATLQVESFANGFSLGLRLGIESYGRKTACGRNGDKCRFSGQKKKRLKTKVPDREEIRLDCGRILCSHVKNAFICGLKLGARMAAEVLSDD